MTPTNPIRKLSKALEKKLKADQKKEEKQIKRLKSILKHHELLQPLYTPEEYDDLIKTSKQIKTKISKIQEQRLMLKQIPRCKRCDQYLNDLHNFFPDSHHTKVFYSSDHKDLDAQINEFNLENFKHIDPHHLNSQDNLCEKCKPKCKKCNQTIPPGYKGDTCQECKDKIKEDLKKSQFRTCECGDSFKMTTFGQRKCLPCKMDPERLERIQSMQNLDRFQEEDGNKDHLNLNKKHESDDHKYSYKSQSMNNLELKKSKSFADIRHEQHKLSCKHHSQYVEFKLEKFQAKVDKPRSVDLEQENYTQVGEKYINKLVKDYQENFSDSSDDGDSGNLDMQSAIDQYNQETLEQQQQQQQNNNEENNNSNNNVNQLQSSIHSNGKQGSSCSILLSNNVNNAQKESFISGGSGSLNGSFMLTNAQSSGNNKRVRYSNIIEIKLDNFGQSVYEEHEHEHEHDEKDGNNDDSSSCSDSFSMDSNDGSDSEEPDEEIMKIDEQIVEQDDDEEEEEVKQKQKGQEKEKEEPSDGEFEVIKSEQNGEQKDKQQPQELQQQQDSDESNGIEMNYEMQKMELNELKRQEIAQFN